MSLDPTLKSSKDLKGTRSVFTRDERITRMLAEGDFDPSENSPFGLPKMRTRGGGKIGTAKKKKAAPAEADAPATDE
jgi:small basic protein (TIGR04137 family)